MTKLNINILFNQIILEVENLITNASYAGTFGSFGKLTLAFSCAPDTNLIFVKSINLSVLQFIMYLESTYSFAFSSLVSFL